MMLVNSAFTPNEQVGGSTPPMDTLQMINNQTDICDILFFPFEDTNISSLYKKSDKSMPVILPI